MSSVAVVGGQILRMDTALCSVAPLGSAAAALVGIDEAAALLLELTPQKFAPRLVLSVAPGVARVGIAIEDGGGCSDAAGSAEFACSGAPGTALVGIAR